MDEHGRFAQTGDEAALLQRWDETTAEIDRLWPSTPLQRYQEREPAFGQWDMPIYALLLYVIDNESHHRGVAGKTG